MEKGIGNLVAVGDRSVEVGDSSRENIRLLALEESGSS